MSYCTSYLNPEIQRHRTATAAIPNGAPAKQVWADERYESPWLHTVPAGWCFSGLQHASEAFDNKFSSLAGQRAGRGVGLPRFKQKGRVRGSFTIPGQEATGAKGASYKQSEARSGVIQDYRHVRPTSFGVLRTHQSTERLVKACQGGNS